jgi:two-component system chemotaxis response regulator CheY
MADYDLTRLNILVVDDNRHMRTLVRSILVAMGIRNVSEAEDGAEALKLMKTLDVDIVICDWLMEPMDGTTFTKMIRKSENSPDIYVPIIMLSGHTEVTRVVTARDAGVNEFLAKPVSATHIYQRIKMILESPRQFIRTNDYFGPDRRRRDDPSYKGEERRRSAEDADPSNTSADGEEKASSN